MIRLLHLDSDKNFLEITQYFLDKLGNFSMRPLTSLQEALAILKTRRVDAIVSGQPEGIELLKFLISQDTAIPFIILTLSGDEEEIIEGLNPGADYFFLRGNESGSVSDQLQQIIGKVVTRSEADQKMVNSCKIPDQNPDPEMRVSKGVFHTNANPAAYLELEEWCITIESLVRRSVRKALSNGILLRTEMEADGSVFQFMFEPEGNKEYVTVYGHH